ncbi:MAG: DNA methyltransferase [Sulfuricurvum sp. PC08-66]|nr:MAG: DNA methyltransferase [Sulfuricurvum sp. PC08-66]
MNTQEKEYYAISEVADLLSVSKETLRRWDEKGKLTPVRHPINNYRVYHRKQLFEFEEAQLMFKSLWDEEMQIKPLRAFRSIELFAGAGGLALGLEKAGFQAQLLNEIDKYACETLKKNRPEWNVVQGDIKNIDFSVFEGKIDLLAGGFPCQAFSYAGNKLGFEDARGTLFYEYARAVKEAQPKIFLAENVRGLLNHDNGRTLATIRTIISEIGYELISEPHILKAMFYQVPQKRERLFLVGVRKDIYAQISRDDFQWPSPYRRIYTLRDALKKGELYSCDVPDSLGQEYPSRKKEILDLVPAGGYWRDLPEAIQREYMQKSYFLGGGKTGMARRLSLDEPSLTLTCAPAQKQTERCHPEETRPLRTREYARIQTFPDDWNFAGSVTNQYKQIGNAVPVNLGYAVGRSLVRLLNAIEKVSKSTHE